MAIISMSDISYDELQEKLNFDDITLRAALDKLIQNSLTVLDPKGELLRSTGHLLRLKGYEVRVLDLLNMEKSHCYNPFVYLRDDNDVQRLVTNLFKSTTPKGSQSNDPFWDTAASMLLLALIFYLKYEAPPDEQNFPMVMEMLRAADMREDCDEYTSPLDEIQHYLRRPALAVQSLF